MSRDGAGVLVRCASRIGARPTRRAGTNAFPAALRRLRPYVVPVYDYVLMTEPLSSAQLARSAGEPAGHRRRGQPVPLLPALRDNRILWGGYDAVYHWRNGLRDALDQRPATFELLAQQFFETFPQLTGLRFTHRWGGAIDTSTRFFAFQGTALGGRVAYSVGYTGLGVAATRFGARRCSTCSPAGARKRRR